MRFAHPQMLWLLASLVPLLAVFLYWSWRTKQKLIGQFVQSRLLANLTVGVSQARQKLRLVLLAAAFCFLFLALARPQWGFDWDEARQQGLDIVVAIDTSRSMLAEDLPPNRLTRAKLAALDLMRLAKNDRLGLVAFAGSAFLQCPLTLDEEAFRQSIDALDVTIIPQGGTALTDAIKTSLSAFEKGTDNHKVLVLFTDGEDHDSGALEAAKEAAKAGLKIFTVGVGTAEGELLRVKEPQGGAAFLKDEDGNVVKSRLNETLLREIATAANGFYLPLRGARPVEMLYAKGLAPLPKNESTTRLVRRYHERFHWPLGLAVILLLVEMFLPQRKRVTRAAATASAGNAELRGAVTLLILLFGGMAATASSSTALKQYNAGKYDDALSEYRRLAQRQTNDYRLQYNAGTAAYRAQRLELAKKHFNDALLSPDLKLQQSAYYNLGNTLYQLGEPGSDPEKTQSVWEQSVQNYENALKLDPKDSDAKHNLEMVKKMLEELKKKQEQQSKDDKSGDKDKKDQKDQKDKKDQGKDSKDKNGQQNKQQDKQDGKQAGNDKDKNSEQPPDPSKQDQAQDKKGQDKKSEEQKKADAKNQKNAQDKDKDKGDQANGDKSKGEQGDESAAAMASLGQMTREQAQQFLDIQKQEEKALIFAPPKKANQPPRGFKDW